MNTQMHSTQPSPVLLQEIGTVATSVIPPPMVPVADLPDDLESIERWQRLFVSPLVDVVRVEMQSHVTAVQNIVQASSQKVEALDTRVKTLEKEQKKALVGWSVYATGVGVIVAAGWKWITSKVHWV